MSLRSLSVALSGLLLVGCQPPPQQPAQQAAQPASPAAAAPVAPTSTPRISPAPGARVYLISPADGDTVTSPVLVRFGLEGAGIAPAGVEAANTGHHHLLIDTELTEFSRPIPADAQHLHFGGGQTEVSVTLAPGRHRLQLVLGDHLHIPHDPPLVSEPVFITVVDESGR